MVGCAEIADGIAAEAKLCRNGPIPKIAFPEQSNLFPLFIGQRHVSPPLLFPWKPRFPEMPIGCCFIVIDRFQMERFDDSGWGQIILPLCQLGQFFLRHC